MGTENIDRHTKTAAARTGVSVEEYVALRLSGLKFCWRCRRWSPVTSFGEDTTRSDGRASTCTPCRRPPRQLPLIRRTPAEYERERYATDPEFRSRRRQRSAHYRRGVLPVPEEGREALLERFGGRCAYCHAPATTWDHIVAVSKGGRTIPGNILPACAHCNSSKKDADINDFIDRAGIAVSAELEAAIAMALEWGQL